MADIKIEYGSTNLTGGNLHVSSTEAFSAPKKNATIVSRARRDGNLRLFDRLEGRSIPLEGFLRSPSQLQFKSDLDDLKYLLMLGKQPLKITECDNTYRQWTEAVLDNLNIARPTTRTPYATYSMEFSTEEAYAVSGDTDTWLNNVNITSGFSNKTFTAQGTYPSYPAITLTINSMTPNNSPVEIQLGNPSTSAYLKFTQTFAAGDVITVDTLGRQAFLNGQLISPDGQFPLWFKGAGSIDYSDTGTARDVNLLMTSERKWL